MSCQTCQSNRVAEIRGKCSDLFGMDYKNKSYQGYAVENIGIGGGDYIDIAYCLECGQIQGEFPVEDPEFINHEGENNEGDW